MKLKELADLFVVKKTVGNLNVDINGIQMDSRKIQKGDLFICVRAIDGFLEDRHRYAEAAVKKGAVALVLERDVPIDVPKIFVKNARDAMGIIAPHFYQYPSKELELIGITGTNGKTTTSYIIDQIFTDAGFTTGLMGNNGVKINNILYSTDINTQEPPDLQRNLRKMSDLHTDYCVMEVSSQGLHTKRVVGCNFKIAVFTNVTEDHLDYHETMEDYKNSKKRLFTYLGNSENPNEKKYAVLNADDPFSVEIARSSTVECITYGIDNEADVRAENISLSAKGISFTAVTFSGKIEIEMKLVGRFNIYNALAAISVALIKGISLQDIKNSLNELKGVSGRMEVINEGQPFLVAVDYAHTPDALQNVLQTIRDFSKGKIITVFGCGGDRDKEKRPRMGEIASMYSDILFVTSDNPRSEDPMEIMLEIEMGIKASTFQYYELIIDREEAIRKAVNMASSKDIVLIAGKGHENYQIINKQKIPFDDREVARKVLRD